MRYPIFTMKPSETHLKGFKSKLIKDYSATKILMFLHFINTSLTFNFYHKPMEAWKANVDTNMMMMIMMMMIMMMITYHLPSPSSKSFENRMVNTLPAC